MHSRLELFRQDVQMLSITGNVETHRQLERQTVRQNKNTNGIKQYSRQIYKTRQTDSDPPVAATRATIMANNIR